MANLKEIRGRITSISSTMQITSAMKMVSAAKLKKAQDAITMLRPYSEKLQELIQKVSTGSEGSLSEYAQKREVKKILYIAISSNRGLAGAFNSSVIKELNANYKQKEDVEIEVLTVGKKVFDAVRRVRAVYDNQRSIYDSVSFEAVSKLTSAVMKDFSEGIFDEVYLVYNKFINAATQEVRTEQLLPITMPEQDIGIISYGRNDIVFKVIDRFFGNIQPFINADHFFFWHCNSINKGIMPFKLNLSHI